MNERELKKLLRNSLELEEQLTELCEECLTKLYGSDAEMVIEMFKEGVDQREYAGCIQSLRSIDGALKARDKHIKELKEKIKENE